MRRSFVVRRMKKKIVCSFLRVIGNLPQHTEKPSEDVEIVCRYWDPSRNKYKKHLLFTKCEMVEKKLLQFVNKGGKELKCFPVRKYHNVNDIQ